jgi:prepilin-type N-terminal cleavage/methylation domain-containing protein
MIFKGKSAPRRPGFTLIELLVVLGIILILATLLMSAITATLAKGPEAQTRHEISQLVNAVESCKASLNRSDGGLPFLPSRIKLDESCTYAARGTPGTDDWFAVYFLQKAFGKTINLTPMPGGPGIDWNGDGIPDSNPANAVTLEGHQALVFWLGGIPTAAGTTPGCQGFKSDPRNPGSLGSGTWRPTYYTFPSNRLQRAANGYLFYVDAFANDPRMPFAYFSSYQGGNDYSKYAANSGWTSDCPSLAAYGLTAGPYQAAAGKFINPKGYQIISAGKDGVFGPGGAWNGYGGGQPGSDDMANFSGRFLSEPPG